MLPAHLTGVGVRRFSACLATRLLRRLLAKIFGVASTRKRMTRHVSFLLSIFTTFAVRPSASPIESPMSAARSALPIGEIQLTASGSRSSSSTPTTV